MTVMGQKVVAELRARADRDEAEGFVAIEIDEVRALATMMDTLDQTATTANTIAEAYQNLEIVVRLLRLYTLNPIMLPDQMAVSAYLREYIDAPGWPALPWPKDLPACARFLTGLGYRNIEGRVMKTPHAKQ